MFSDMRFFVRLFVLFNLYALIAANSGPSHGKLVVCPVLSSYAAQLVDPEFDLKQAKLNLCTHLVCYDDNFLDTDVSSVNTAKKDYEIWTNLQNEYPHLNVSLSVQIEHYISDFLHLFDEVYRKEYIQSTVEFVKKNNFTGMELFFRHLDDIPREIEKVEEHLLQLSESFRQSGLLLTASISASDDYLEKEFNYSRIFEHFDFIHYQDATTSTEFKDISSLKEVLASQSISRYENNMDKLIELGVPPQKLVMGVQLFGSGFSYENDVEKLEPEEFKAYRTICSEIDDKWQKTFDNSSCLSVLTNEEEKLVIVFENTRSVANKLRLAMKRGLAGVVSTYISNDDYQGKCSIDQDTFIDFHPVEGVKLTIPKRNETTFPILRTINEAIVVALDEIQQEAVLNADSHSSNITPYGLFIAVAVLLTSYFAI